MFYQLPPVGDPITWSVAENSGRSPETLFWPYQASFYDSGTSALAAAITAATEERRVDRPQVILPAYGCPDLVAAAVHAGAEPVLADLESDKPWMDLAQVEKCITGNTVAVVAVDLFGIPERLTELRGITQPREIALIEDSAQSFPVSESGEFWYGDYVVLSFGRGKPVSLLGGGALLTRGHSQAGLPEPGGDRSNALASVSLRLKAALYNRMLHPRWYWLPQSLPFLHLGETRFHPLSGISPMDRGRRKLLSANIAVYRTVGVATQQTVAAVVEDISAADERLLDLPRVCGVDTGRRMLRYPLLVDAGIRDRLLLELRRRGLGPSVMYPAALPSIEGLRHVLRPQGPFPAAENFAKRILTLPVHRQVRPRDIAAMRHVFESFAR